MRILPFMLFAATLFISSISHAQETHEFGSLDLNLSSLNAAGQYKNFFSDAKNKFGSDEMSNMALGIAAWIPITKKAEAGIDFTYFGSNRAYGNASGNYESIKDNVFSSAAALKINFLDYKLQDNAMLRIYAKAGAGLYSRSLKYDMHDIFSNYYNGSKTQFSPGYNYAIGANILLRSKWYVGLEYRMDKMSDNLGIEDSNITVPAFESKSIGVRLGYSFDITIRREKKEKKAPALKPAIQIEGSATPVEKKQPYVYRPSDIVQPKTKTSDEDAVGVLKAANPTPGKAITELDKAKYLAETAKIKANLPESGKLEIPSVGVLFKIGQKNLLPYYNEMLNSFMDLYIETDGTAKILIEGYSSNAGNETKTNPKLSQQRAQSVADYFILNDIPAALIEVRHYSNTKIKDGIFDADKNCKASQCYRRVNISIKP